MDVKKVFIFGLLMISTTVFAWSPYTKISTGLGRMNNGTFRATASGITLSKQLEYETSMVSSACVGAVHEYGIFVEGVLAYQNADGNYQSDTSNKVEVTYTQCGLQVGGQMFSENAIQPYMMFGIGYLLSSFEDSIGEAKDALAYGSFTMGVKKEIAGKYGMYAQVSRIFSEVLTDTYELMGLDVNIEAELEISQITIGICAKF